MSDVPAECVGSGWCCKKGPCGVGLAMGFKTREPCPKLVESGGRHWCGLVLESEGNAKAKLLNRLGVGSGCGHRWAMGRLRALGIESDED